MKRIYVAYGSNMNIEQMAMRCPTAKLIGKGVLKDWKLEFRGMENNAVATIKPEVGSEVLALLWELQPEDEAALDRYEGFPVLYRKEMVEVYQKDKVIKAMVYIMNPGRSLGKPSGRYFEIIRRGYNSAGYDTGVLVKAVRDSAFAEPENKRFDMKDFFYK
jgi:gamma-glutamylcyclotransferase (GGCT)/AIG2-like uncharacterized protein YtfP